MSKKLMFVVNVDWFFISHRLLLAQTALEKGYDVHIACNITDKLEQMEGFGFIVHPLDLIRENSSILSIAKNFLQIFSLFWREKPDIVHLVTIKPVLLGGIVARLVGVRGVVAAISGLGFTFTSKGFIAIVRRFLIGILYRLSLHADNVRVIFQNIDDRDKITSLAGLNDEDITMISGSGVDLQEFNTGSDSGKELLVILPARMLKDKGVVEFSEAARFLVGSGIKKDNSARFVLVGDPDPGNPASLSLDQIQAWVEKGYIEHWNYQKDMARVFAQSSIVVLPSYREGFPKVLMEAAACGKPVVTTNVPGCKDAIIPNVTGLLVPKKDSYKLALAIEELIKSPELRNKMGRNGRYLAEQAFDVKHIVSQHMKIYNNIIS